MTDEDLGQEIICGTGCLPSIGDIRHIGATARRLVTAELAARALADEDALRSDILNAMHEPCENCATDIIDAIHPHIAALQARAEAAEAENARLREAIHGIFAARVYAENKRENGISIEMISAIRRAAQKAGFVPPDQPLGATETAVNDVLERLEAMHIYPKVKSDTWLGMLKELQEIEREAKAARAALGDKS